MSSRRRRVLIGLTALVAVCLLAAPAAVLALSLSNPPKLAGSSFTVKVKGLSGTLSVYLSPKRKLAHGDVSLGHQKPKHGKLTIKIRSTVKPGAYFVLVCKGSGHHRKCIASKRPTVVAPTSTIKFPHIPAGTVTLSNGTATLATANAVSATLGAGGGTLSATGPEGTKYTLAYGANSVQNGTAVTMTPLSGLSGSGLGTFDGGVELSPATVRFIRGAVLIIEPSHAVAASSRHAVEFTGAGEGIHAIPTAPQKAPIVLPVGVTNGYALLSGGSSQAVAARAHAASHGPLAHIAGGSTTSGRTTFYQEELSTDLHQLIESGGDIGDGSAAAKAYEAAVVATLKEWYAEIIANEVPPGMESDEAAETAENDLAAWAQDAVTLLGDGHTTVGGATTTTTTYDGMSALFGPNWEEEKVLSVDQKLDSAAYDRAQEKCANNHELGQIPTIAEWYRSDVFAGHPDSVSTEELLVCDHFTVEFESTMEDKLLGEDDAALGSYVNEYTANVKIKPQTETAGLPINGSATGSYAQATGTVKASAPCKEGPNSENESIDEGGNPTTFKVINFTPPTASGGQPTLTFETGMPTENYLVKATEDVCDPFPMVVREPNWWVDWDAQHKGAAVPDTLFTYQFTLTAGGGADFGTISFEDQPFDKENAEGLENTKITVTHTPAPFTRL
jgi:hypothetical protein